MGLRRFLKNFFYKKKFEKKKYINNLSGQKILITGCNSGIGLALTKELLKSGNYVFGVVKQNSTNISKIKSSNLKIITCDLRKIENYDQIEKNLKNIKIDVVFNCAGMFGGSSDEQSIKGFEIGKLNDVLMTNSLSAILISKIILKNSKPKVIVNFSSDAGSINLNNGGDHYFYRISKSTMNAITKNLSVDLSNKIGTTVFSVDPGNVSTNMNPKGLINSEESIKSYLKLFRRDHIIIKEEYIAGRDICFGAVINNSELFPLVILEEWHRINTNGKISVKGISVLNHKDSIHLLKKILN